MSRVSGKSDADAALSRIGGVLRAERKLRNLSQEALADAAGLDRSHMGRIERGERNVTILNLLRISKALAEEPSSILRKAGL